MRKTIEFLSPGIWNAEEGPDFKKVLLRIGNKDFFSDVELYLRTENCYHHKHHQDANYNNVVLHFVFYSENINTITTYAGSVVPVAYMEDNLIIYLRSVVNNMGFEFYPYKRFVGSVHYEMYFRRKIYCNDIDIYCEIENQEQIIEFMQTILFCA
jgi:hypothetical protein